VKPLVVTSFSAKGYEQYGRRFMTSVQKHWPLDEIDLVVYREDKVEVPGIDAGSVFEIEDIPYYRKFVAKYRAPIVFGKDSCIGKWKTKEIDVGYNFRFDANKFCRKVFAIFDASLRFKERRLFWVDSDVVALRPMPAEFLDELIPEGYQMCHLGRKGTHSECGFVGYDLSNSDVRDFVTDFADTYVNGTVFDLPEWHDSFVFDVVRSRYRIKSNNLSRALHGHVWITSPLATYMDHLKGNRKGMGRSPELPGGDIACD
jgi:hypothetical protein